MRDKLLQLLIISVGILIIVKLFSLQVINSSSELINNNASVQKIYEFPERGYIYDRNNKLIVSNDFSYDILVVPADVNLEDSILISKDFNIDTSVLNEKLLDAKNFSNVKASILINNISKDEYAPIQEKLWKHSGFFVQKKSKRTYNALTAANLLGYISEVNKSEIEKNSYYEIGEMIGRQGLEKTYEDKLRLSLIHI